MPGLRYKDPEASESQLIEQPFRMASIQSASSDMQFAVAVASFGMLLRDSEHIEGWELKDVIELAERSVGSDPERLRRNFVAMARKAEAMGLLAATP